MDSLQNTIHIKLQCIYWLLKPCRHEIFVFALVFVTTVNRMLLQYASLYFYPQILRIEIRLHYFYTDLEVKYDTKEHGTCITVGDGGISKDEKCNTEKQELMQEDRKQRENAREQDLQV